MASNLHNNTPQKLSLLRNSLSYFQKAAEYITYAGISIENDDLSPGNRSSSASSTSSARSSVDSVFSSISFPSTADELSPAFSSSSYEDESSYVDDDKRTPIRRRRFSESSVASTESAQSADTYTTPDKPAPMRIKKKVSFSPELPTFISTQIETPPRAIQSPVTPHRPIISSKYQSTSLAHPFLNERLTSYNLHLSSLTAQLTYHITHVKNLVDAVQNVRKSRRNIHSSFTPSLFNSSGDLNHEDGEEMKRKDIRERIEKLRSSGWKKKRWDGSRYEALREKVENELNGCI
ncbi:hypothetical protein NHQ30_010980 [Ciborinia camelliae]|nr:hypothetical protein NHQ30_010980 [Ciborinia camelliae]